MVSGDAPYSLSTNHYPHKNGRKRELCVNSDDNIILVGFSGTGKTMAGQEVALLLGWGFIDTDAEIEQEAGKPVYRVFQEDGEPAFRLLEKQAIREGCSGQGRVVSTGGGAVVDPENREFMLKQGVVVCLDALPETIYERLMGVDAGRAAVRPLLSGPEPLERIKALKAGRHEYYSSAHVTVHTDGLSIEQVAQEVVKAWRLFSASSESASPEGNSRVADEATADEDD